MTAQKPIFISEAEKQTKTFNRTHTERFDFLMRLIKISAMLKKAKIVYPNK